MVMTITTMISNMVMEMKDKVVVVMVVMTMIRIMMMMVMMVAMMVMMMIRMMKMKMMVTMMVKMMMMMMMMMMVMMIMMMMTMVAIISMIMKGMSTVIVIFMEISKRTLTTNQKKTHIVSIAKSTFTSQNAHKKRHDVRVRVLKRLRRIEKTLFKKNREKKT